MEIQENQPIALQTDAVVAIPKVSIPKIYENPRQVAYSYLLPEELIKVASLSKKERQTVLTSKIIWENRKKIACKCFCVYVLQRYSTEVALQGLLMVIQFSSEFSLVLDVNEFEPGILLQRLVQILPALTSAIVRTGTYFGVTDQIGNEALNGIVAAAIEKSGALIDTFQTESTSTNAVRLIAKAKQLHLGCRQQVFLKELLTYNEFPQLKRFRCDNKELAVTILARSQLEYFQTDIRVGLAFLPQLASQTQLQEVMLDGHEFSSDDIIKFISSLPNSVQKLNLDLYFKDVDDGQLLEFLLDCKIQSIKWVKFRSPNLRKLLDKYLDANQQSEGNRVRNLHCWKFCVSANNRILKLE